MFIRTKKVGDRAYQYLVESYRDPETGKPRQKHRKYLGKVLTFGTTEDQEQGASSTQQLLEEPCNG